MLWRQRLKLVVTTESIPPPLVTRHLRRPPSTATDSFALALTIITQ